MILAIIDKLQHDLKIVNVTNISDTEDILYAADYIGRKYKNYTYAIDWHIINSIHVSVDDFGDSF